MLDFMNNITLHSSTSCCAHFHFQEERRAQLPKYQRNLPRPGQAPIGNPPVGPIGGMMPPQPGIPQQQGMRPPMPPHGIDVFMFH